MSHIQIENDFDLREFRSFMSSEFGEISYTETQEKDRTDILVESEKAVDICSYFLLTQTRKRRGSLYSYLASCSDKTLGVLMKEALQLEYIGFVPSDSALRNLQSNHSIFPIRSICTEIFREQALRRTAEQLQNEFN